MSIKQIIKEQKKESVLDKKTLDYLKKETKVIMQNLNEEIKEQKINASPFIGGSFAKGTIFKKDEYDIDIFIRFDWKIQDISSILEKIVSNIANKLFLTFIKIHGSRDYFRLSKSNVLFELIPVYKIKKPKTARNVTDLSYFHVNYVKNKINKKLAEEIILAKKFCQSQGVYGAESYIQGFSGYALECLIIYYKSFEKMLKSLAFIKERIIIDIEKKYKKRSDILFEMNESKLRSPIVLVDPTFKERNILAALSKETFEKFQERSGKFIKAPSLKFFQTVRINEEKLKRLAKTRKAELLYIKLYTDKQPGDIAGTKMKKFSKFLERELGNYFFIFNKEFEYLNGQESNFYIVLKAKKEVVKLGPPIKMEKNSLEFKKRNKNVFVKNGYFHARMKINFTARLFLQRWMIKNRRKMNEMGILGFEVKDDWFK